MTNRKPFLTLTSSEKAVVNMLINGFELHTDYEISDLFNWAQEAKADAYENVLIYADPNPVEIVDFAQATVETIVKEFTALTF